MCVAENVSFVVFFWNLPPHEWIVQLHGGGLKAWATASSADEAKAAAAYDVDAIVVQGAEAGGHVRAQLGLIPLLPAVHDTVRNLPLIAAGGIADGRGVGGCAGPWGR